MSEVGTQPNLPKANNMISNPIKKTNGDQIVLENISFELAEKAR